jgi:hypothetical protein
LRNERADWRENQSRIQFVRRRLPAAAHPHSANTQSDLLGLRDRPDA